MSVELLGKAVGACEALTATVEEEFERLNGQANNAIRQLGQNGVVFYVDPILGSDNNSGTKENEKLKSLKLAFNLAASPAYEGCFITIYLEPESDYFIDFDETFYNRIVIIASRGLNKPNVYQKAKVVTSNKNYFGTFGIKSFNSTVRFQNCKLYTPLFNELVGHDRVLTSSSGGVFHPVSPSHKTIEFSGCELHIGDQFIVVPSPGDFTFASFSSCSIHLRVGREVNSCPISLNSSLAVINFYNSTLHDGLQFIEGSLVSGVKFNNGLPINLVTNVNITEAV